MHDPKSFETLMMKDLREDKTMSNLYAQESFASADHPQLQPPLKKKRGLPGNPDPDAEVVALSPKTLLATHRFVCEVCNKGFQRDQNLQLHRRGHNLPWKLKQRANKEVVKKKVYVCPEPSCVHHEPSRALGDLTGIKKHFCRKHGEKKWKCDKCSKKYAVQSDWKAHSKICGTREYRCDCGTIFSRRDSFITHRAFCDGLLEETARRAITAPNSDHPLLSPLHQPITVQPFQVPSSSSSSSLSIKKELFQDHNQLGSNIPQWLGPAGPGPCPRDHNPIVLSSSPLLAATTLDDVKNPFSGMYQTIAQGVASSPHMSATALLQKAAQMGVRLSHNTENNIKSPPSQSSLLAGFSSSDSNMGTSASMVTFGENKAATANSLLEDMLATGNNSLSSGFDGSCTSSFDDGFIGMLNRRTATESQFTRDFLGLKALIRHSRDFVNISRLEQQMSLSPSRYRQGQSQSQTHWQG